MSANVKVIINFICFQLAWFGCVLGAAHRMPWFGVAVTLLVLAWHFYSSAFFYQALKLVIVIVCIGGIFDQFMLTGKLIEYQHHGWGMTTTLVPVWILALWAGFATSLNVSLRWMREKKFIAILFGFLGGPLAYIGAEKLGAVVLNGKMSLLTLAIGWAVMMPFFLMLSKRYDGFKHNLM